MKHEAEEPGGTEPLRRRLAEDVRHGAAAGAAAGGHAAGELGQAAEAMALEVVPTGLGGERVILGHVLGMHLSIPAGHLHGPREAPALLYLFADALAVRLTDDAPMSTVPVLGLHMVLPPLAIARWLYKAGRIEHANLDLVRDEQRFADALAQWTVDDFAEADPKVRVHRVADLQGPMHVYGHLGFAHVWFSSPGSRPTHLKSALPASSNAYAKLWQLFALVGWPGSLSAERPADLHDASAPPGPGTAPPPPVSH